MKNNILKKTIIGTVLSIFALACSNESSINGVNCKKHNLVTELIESNKQLIRQCKEIQKSAESASAYSFLAPVSYIILIIIAIYKGNKNLRNQEVTDEKKTQ